MHNKYQGLRPTISGASSGDAINHFSIWATLKCVYWFNNRRNHESLDYVPLAEFDAHCHDTNQSERLAVQKCFSLPETRRDSRMARSGATHSAKLRRAMVTT